MNEHPVHQGRSALICIWYLDMMQLAWMLAPLLVIMGALDQLVRL
nr:hypothetical protein Q903MT_gene4511 [Picea sitchensis]